MLRKITPFLIIGITLIIWSIYGLITDGKDWGGVAAIAIFVFALIVLFIDVILKRFIKKYNKTLLIELSIVLILFLAYQYTFNRTQTLIIPDAYEKDYVTILYGVEGADKINISPLTVKKDIIIPSNGVLITLSKIDEHLPKTKMRTNSGVYFNSENSKKQFVEMGKSNVEFTGALYSFRIFKIQEEFCCSITIEEKEKIQNSLKTELKRIKASR
ncbi:hypothetical protein [Robertkochia flava]|uniref:hypothetical protein n=1 Tax=Robertkochia flava TaxID=3447986 RepID=UPI001CCF4418|nr:hypothetical protein [Robertkochia marina]